MTINKGNHNHNVQIKLGSSSQELKKKLNLKITGSYKNHLSTKKNDDRQRGGEVAASIICGQPSDQRRINGDAGRTGEGDDSVRQRRRVEVYCLRTRSGRQGVIF